MSSENGILKAFFALSLMLFAATESRAQDPDETFFPVSDESHYPYRAEWEVLEPVRIPQTDTTIFYRAAAHAQDVFGRETQYNFFHVAYDRGTRNALNYNGLPLYLRYGSTLARVGAVALDEQTYTSVAVAQPAIRRVGVQSIGRNYAAGVQAQWAESLPRDWYVNAFVRGRAGRDFYVDGVFGRRAEVAVRAVKSGERSELEFTLVAEPEMRALRSAAPREAAELAGSDRYNPAWGMQRGSVRSARIRRAFVPLLMTRYLRKISENTSFDGSVTAEMGVSKLSGLQWFDARSPLPDAWRALPSGQDDPRAGEELAALWRAGEVGQLDWEKLYAQNRAASTAVFALADRVERVTMLGLRAGFQTNLEDVSLRYYARAGMDRRRNYRQMRDLLGAPYLVDHDAFLLDDQTQLIGYQNDTRHPDRRVGAGDRFGYDYAFQVSTLAAGASAEWGVGRWTLSGALEIGSWHAYRRGFYQKEIFPTSYGRSRTVSLSPFALRAGAAWAISARMGLSVDLDIEAKPPFVSDLFLNSEYNNRLVDTPRTEKRYDLRVAWAMTLPPDWEFYAAAYWTRTADGMQMRHYWDDAAAAFCDLLTEQIATRHMGIEAVAIFHPTRRWELKASFSAGLHRYAADPRVSVWRDTDNVSVDVAARARMGGISVGSVPGAAFSTEAGFFGRRGWGFRAGVDVVADRWMEAVAVRRTDRMSRALADSPEAYGLITAQERLPAAVDVHAALFKTWWWGEAGQRVTLAVTARNLLGIDAVYGGYESPRVHRQNDTYRPMATRYLAAYPRQIQVSVTMHF